MLTGRDVVVGEARTGVFTGESLGLGRVVEVEAVVLKGARVDVGL